jgi:hypothetical protein
MTNGCFVSLPWSGHARRRGATPVRGCGPGGVDRPQSSGRVGGQGRDRTGHGRVGRDPAVDARLGAQNSEVGQTVTAQREAERQIRDDLARIMDRQRFAPPSQSQRQQSVQTGRGDGPGEQDPAGLPDRSRRGRVDPDTGIQASTLHPEGAP